MPSTKQSRKVDHHCVAQDPIPADQFIPRFLHADNKAIKPGDTVGVRGFTCANYERYSPYLMMSDITVAPPLLFPEHPHCGHEMALYVLEGEFTHEDFGGWKETFQTSDLHWMTTGRGIVHAQKPGAGSRNRHVQFWINLPKDKKQVDPANQVLRSRDMPCWKDDVCGAEIRLLVGRYGEHESPIKVATPLLMMDVKIAPNDRAPWELHLPGDYMAGMYVIEGEGEVGGGQRLQPGSIAFSQPGGQAEDSTVLSVQAKRDKSLRFLIFAGQPIREPMDYEGFFVCSEKHETAQAIKDFEGRVNGFAKSKSWTSKLC